MAIFSLVLATAAVAATPLPPADREVEIGHGAAALHGALIAPDPAHPGPAVLLLPGSGAENRNGDDLEAGQRSQTLKLIAESLAADGIGSLRIDKRGVGASAAAALPPKRSTVDRFVRDAVSWAKFLRAQPGVRCVVILGHSEGALIAALAAQKVKTCGVISASGSSRDFGALVESQNAIAQRPPELVARQHAIILELRRGHEVSDIPPELAGVFGPAIQPYTRSMINLDPVAELRKVKAPVLVLQGDNDLQVRVDDAKALAARPGAQLVVVKGMTHPLKLATSDVKTNIATYLDPALPLAPDAVAAIIAFVRARG
jgi:pimeloyl-ACP methyl ester carboxylesterase